jgi:phosphoesterase RecJ-like protein
MSIKGIKKAVKMVKDSRSILIAGHVNPDGDSIGSLLSLGLGLKKLGKRVFMVSFDPIPAVYRKLSGASEVKKSHRGRVDLAIAVDCSDKNMLGENFLCFKPAANIIEIDHHDLRRSFGDVSIIDKNAAAVGELVYLFLRALGVNISCDIAENILTSLIVETNSFRLPGVRPLTFNICARLLETGVDYYRLTDMVYWSSTRESAILSAICLSRSRFAFKGKLAWSTAGIGDFKKFKAKSEDVDRVADQLRSIEDVKIAVLFREMKDNTLRVSLRSKDMIDVARLAGIFGGGGHVDNAGCVIPNDIKSKKYLLKLAGRLLTT